jgi:DNA-binding CsgD family transcriptional regulator
MRKWAEVASSRRAAAVPSNAGTELDRARAAWDAGEYGRVLDLTAAGNSVRREDRVATAVLEARALLALDRPGEVAAALERATKDAKNTEESALVQMLLGAALTRTNQRERGEALLDDALTMASRGAPRLVPEIGYYRALSRWSSHHLDEAEAIVESALLRASDAVRPRLLHLLGWIDVRRENYAAAAQQFAATLDGLEKSRQNDLKVRTSSLHALGIIAAETIDLRLGRLVRRNYESCAWPDDARIERFYVLEYLTWLSLLEGEIARAWDERQLALSLTINSGHHASALISAARVASIVGDRYSATRYLELAGVLLLRGDQVDLDVDRRLVMLSFAGAVPPANPETAAKVLALYDRTRARHTNMLAFEGDRRLEAYELYARAKVTAALGNRQRAIDELGQSLDLWTRLGYRLRTAIAAGDLRDITGERRWAQIGLEALRNAPKAWLRPSLERGSADDDPLGKLTPAERRVLTELCKGKKSRDIAITFGRSFNTINNHTRKVFAAFGVQSRAALVAECAKLGILDDQDASR